MDNRLAELDSGRDDLRDRVSSGLRWTALDQVVQQTMRFAITIALTHLISPTDFGVVGVAFVFSEFGSMVGDVGMGPALVHRRDLSDRDVATSMVAGGVMGALLAAALVAVSAPLARFFDEPTLRPVLIVLSLNFVLKGLTGTLHYLFRRALEFRPFVVCYAVAVGSSGALAIALAAGHHGVGALVAYSIGEAAVGLVMAAVYAWRLGLWRPKLAFDRVAAREMVGFGASVSGTRLLTYGRQNLDNLLVGRYLGTTALGLYNLAYRTMLYPVQRVSDIISGIAFPAFATIQHDVDRMASGFLRAVRTISVVVFPVSIGSVVAAPVLVPFLFGPKWVPAVATLQILAFNGPRMALNGLNAAVFQAIRKPNWDLALNAVSFGLVVIAFGIGVQYGIEQVAIGFTVAGFLVTPFSLHLVARALGLRLRDLGAAVRPVASATVALAAAAEAAVRAVPEAWPNAIRLAIVIAAGTVAYAGVLAIVGRDILRAAVQDVLSRTRR